MAQQTIKFGTPPLGIGGDSFITAFDKCNANFTELYSSMKEVSEGSNIYRYKNLATYYSAASAAKGAIVIHLPTAKFNSKTMMTLRVRGYAYTAGQGAWSLELGGYNYIGSAWHNHSGTLTGRAPFSQVQFAHATDHQVIILGVVGTTWAYPSVQVEELITQFSSTDNWGSNWRITLETDLTPYTNVVATTLLGTNRSLSADKLTNARTINGVSFDGTANITVADSTKLPLAGGTMTGSLTIKGAASASPLNVRGIQGTTEDGVATGGGLYLNHVNTAANTYFNGTAHYINGGTYTGNSASATKLATARTINGTSFDGTANVTTANWGTARNITIGSTAKSVNGSAAVAWTLAEIGAVPAVGGTITGNLDLKNGTTEMQIRLGSEGGYVYGNTTSIGLYKTGDSTKSIRLDLATGAVTNGAGTWTGNLTGNAGSATKLATARTINGVSFNGTANISINSLVPTAIPANADFNSYETPGMYFCGANATAKTLVNRPTDNAFSLLVEKHAGVKQTVTEYMVSGHKTYIRNKYSSTWGAWVRVHTTIDAPVSGQFIGSQATKAIAYNAQNISEDVTIPGNVNALSAGPITIDSDKTVTVTSGATWTIV